MPRTLIIQLRREIAAFTIPGIGVPAPAWRAFAVQLHRWADAADLIAITIDGGPDPRGAVKPVKEATNG